MMSLRDTLKLLAQLDREDLVGLGDHLVEEQRIDGGRLLADDASQCRALGAVTLAGRDRLPYRCTFKRGGRVELRGRQLEARW